MSREIEIRHFHLFCGLGGGAKGFNEGEARVGSTAARFRCLGGVDVEAASSRDFERLVGVPATRLDLFSREQYEAFHGVPPPDDWREASPADLHAAAGHERPHIVFLSAPCKGFSGLLSEKASKSDKYQALNALTLRGMWLMLEAWAGDPPELIVFENVPRIARRGRGLLDQIVALLASYGYRVAETAHDCGELGGLAQSRKRFLLVARHAEKVPPFLYEPVKRPLRGVGEVIGRLPLPGPEPLLPMHRLPALQWKTWVRLAFVEAGSDWRSLNRLRVEDGMLADFGIIPEAQMHNGVLGVLPWNGPSGTVTGNARPATGAFSIADPRVAGHPKSVQLGVRPWDRPAGVVTGKMIAGGGPHSVADPRLAGTAFNHVYRIVDWSAVSPAVAGSGGPAGGLSVADPRPDWHNRYGNMPVIEWDRHAGTVHQGGKGVQGGAMSVADPRPVAFRGGREHYEGGGHYGVVGWHQHGRTVAASSNLDNGYWSVADPRVADASIATGDLPGQADRLVCMIRSLDGTWHRPFTTLELAALQGLVCPEETLELDGLSDSAWRERIGNAVPPPAARAIAGVMGRTLLMAWSGETFALSNEPIWVRPVAAALSVEREMGR